MSRAAHAALRAASRGPARSRQFFLLSVLVLPLLMILVLLANGDVWRDYLSSIVSGQTVTASKGMESREACPTCSTESCPTCRKVDEVSCSPFTQIAQAMTAKDGSKKEVTAELGCATLTAPTFERELCFSDFKQTGDIYGGHITATILLKVTKQELKGAGCSLRGLRQRQEVDLHRLSQTTGSLYPGASSDTLRTHHPTWALQMALAWAQSRAPAVIHFSSGGPTCAMRSRKP